MKPPASATAPWINGRIPPPQTITMKIPEAAAVYLPKPSTAKLKIPPHMMEVHKPQRAMNMIPTGTSTIPKEISDKNTGILTLVVAGAKIAIKIKIIPTVAADDNIALLEILAPKEAPNKRSESSSRTNMYPR